MKCRIEMLQVNKFTFTANISLNLQYIKAPLISF